MLIPSYPTRLLPPRPARSRDRRGPSAPQRIAAASWSPHASNETSQLLDRGPERLGLAVFYAGNRPRRPPVTGNMKLLAIALVVVLATSAFGQPSHEGRRGPPGRNEGQGTEVPRAWGPA